MGIFDALNTSVAGLQSQSFALQNISGNIANTQTTGYKGINTSFVDLIPDATAPDRQVAGSVTAYAQSTISTQGNVSAATVSTYMAITGDGFFSVQMPTGVTDNVPTFGGTTDYTRRGDFQVNANGNLVNGAGYYLMGFNVDPSTGNPTGNSPVVLQFQNNFIPARATSTITYAANLPATPATAASSTATAGSLLAAGGLDPTGFAATGNPLPLGTPAIPYGNTSVTGAVANQIGPAGPITGNTLLSGAANALSTGFAAGDTITVNGTTLKFVNTGTNLGASPPVIDITDKVSTLLGEIDALNGNTTNPSSISAAGAITLNTGLANNLNVTTTNSAAFGALGLLSSVTATRTGGVAAGSGIVEGADGATFDKESISGGAVTAYNAAGTPVDVQLRWAKVDSAALGAPHQDQWNLFYQTDPSAQGANTEWVNVGTTFTFNSAGVLTSPSGSGITIPNLTVSGQNLGNVTFNFGSGALTQYASTSGAATINGITQNGYAAGQLESVAINNDGMVVGTFTNGQNLDLAQVTLSHFNGTNYLQALSGGAYAVTDQSGPAIIGASGKISGSSLEGSNTDVADEFTKLIVTQQAYSANTKVITTANSMVQDLLNVLR